MRIHIKVYIEALKDQDCAGQKPDFWVSADTVEDAIGQIRDLEKTIEERELGIPDEPEDFSGAGDNDER